MDKGNIIGLLAILAVSATKRCLQVISCESRSLFVLSCGWYLLWRQMFVGAARFPVAVGSNARPQARNSSPASAGLELGTNAGTVKRASGARIGAGEASRLAHSMHGTKHYYHSFTMIMSSCTTTVQRYARRYL